MIDQSCGSNQLIEREQEDDRGKESNCQETGADRGAQPAAHSGKPAGDKRSSENTKKARERRNREAVEVVTKEGSSLKKFHIVRQGRLVRNQRRRYDRQFRRTLQR